MWPKSALMKSLLLIFYVFSHYCHGFFFVLSHIQYFHHFVFGCFFLSLSFFPSFVLSVCLVYFYIRIAQRKSSPPLPLPYPHLLVMSYLSSLPLHLLLCTLDSTPFASSALLPFTSTCLYCPDFLSHVAFLSSSLASSFSSTLVFTTPLFAIFLLTQSLHSSSLHWFYRRGMTYHHQVTSLSASNNTIVWFSLF